MEAKEKETPEEQAVETPEMETPAEDNPVDQEASGEPTDQPTENKLLSYINRFAPGSDTSTPEATLAACEAVFGKMVPFYDKVYDLAATDQEAAATLYDWLETGNLVKAIARNYDPEEKQALVEELEDGAYEEDRNAYREKTTAIKGRLETINKNKEVSLEKGSQFMEDRKHWPPEKANAFLDFMTKHYDDGADGIISMQDLEMLEKAFTYDDDVAEAEENGKVMGRNENIVTQRLSRKDINGIAPEPSGGSAPLPKSNPKSFGAKFMDGVI